jgi:hypothetical protein
MKRFTCLLTYAKTSATPPWSATVADLRKYDMVTHRIVHAKAPLRTDGVEHLQQNNARRTYSGAIRAKASRRIEFVELRIQRLQQLVGELAIPAVDAPEHSLLLQRHIANIQF